MAIIIEEEKDRSGLLVLLGWLLVIVVIVLIVYFVFFKNPEIIEVVGPGSFERTIEVSRINIEPNVVTSHPAFESRRSQVVTPGEGVSGRSNPFLPF